MPGAGVSFERPESEGGTLFRDVSSAVREDGAGQPFFADILAGTSLWLDDSGFSVRPWFLFRRSWTMAVQEA